MKEFRSLADVHACQFDDFGITVIVPRNGEFLSPAARQRLLEELP